MITAIREPKPIFDHCHVRAVGGRWAPIHCVRGTSQVGQHRRVAARGLVARMRRLTLTLVGRLVGDLLPPAEGGACRYADRLLRRLGLPGLPTVQRFDVQVDHILLVRADTAEETAVWEELDRLTGNGPVGEPDLPVHLLRAGAVGDPVPVAPGVWQLRWRRRWAVWLRGEVTHLDAEALVWRVAPPLEGQVGHGLVILDRGRRIASPRVAALVRARPTV